MIQYSFGIPEISLRHLKSALYVAEHKNLTRAANLLNRSQTAVTKAISDLEATLALQLFDRSSKGMTPTVYGEALAARVMRALAEFETARDALMDFHNSNRNYHTIPVFNMEISYKRLAAFIALYEKREVSSAADALGVTKAAIYNSIHQLEELLDTKLFQREPHGVAPTPFSSILARHTKLAFAEIRHAIDDLASLNGVTQGCVSIGTLPYTRTFLTPRAINKLLEKHPQLDVSTREGPYSVLETSLRSGDIDFIVGAIRESGLPSDIATETLFSDRLSIIVRKGHPLIDRQGLDFNDLKKAHWVLPTSETPARKLFDETLKKHQLNTPEHAVETSSLAMVRGLLLDSDRVALLSEHQIFYEKKYGLLDVLPVKLAETYRPIGITMRAHTQPSPAAQLFLDELRATAKEVKQVSSTTA